MAEELVVRRDRNGVIGGGTHVDRARDERQVVLYDTTLRDGEQQAGVAFDVTQKVEIFRQIEAVGVPVIETGFIAISDDEAEVVRRLKADGTTSKVFLLARCMTEDLERAAAAGADGVTLEMIANPALAERIFGWTRKELVERASEHAKVARDLGLEVNFFGIDATRADVTWLGEFYGNVSASTELDSVTIADSFGATGPTETAALVEVVRAATNAPVQVHCHNDLGLAVANSLAAVDAGATFVQGTVNGLGERAGNADLGQVAVAVAVLRGWTTDVDLSGLRNLSTAVARESGQAVEANRAVVGPRLFEIESGVAAAILERLDGETPELFYTYLPELLGTTPVVRAGKGSGIANLRLALASAGIPAVDEAVLRDRLPAVKSRGQEAHRCLTVEELLEVLQLQL